MRWDEFLTSERVELKRMNRTLLDLGDDHVLSFSVGDAESWEDVGLPPQEPHDGRRMVLQGAIVNHRTADGSTCGGGINFARPLQPSERERNMPLWRVLSFEPLTLSPSLLCHCGDHGWIREGRWTRA